MESDVKRILPGGRWSIAEQDKGYWRVGVYKPECGSPDEITVLEKHTCPELFICQRGRSGLLLKSDSGERQVVMEPGESLLVTGYHNGFSVDGDGYFIVVERTAFTTEYIDRQSGKVVNTVQVK
jgi:hypothetical protein